MLVWKSLAGGIREIDRWTHQWNSNNRWKSCAFVPPRSADLIAAEPCTANVPNRLNGPGRRISGRIWRRGHFLPRYEMFLRAFSPIAIYNREHRTASLRHASWIRGLMCARNAMSGDLDGSLSAEKSRLTGERIRVQFPV